MVSELSSDGKVAAKSCCTDISQLGDEKEKSASFRKLQCSYFIPKDAKCDQIADDSSTLHPLGDACLPIADEVRSRERDKP